VKRLLLLVTVLIVSSLSCASLHGADAPTTAPAAKPATRPQPQIERVMVVSIDGLRPDVMLLSDAPTLRSLITHGSYSLWAKTTVQSITLPSHVSMMTGVTVEGHGIVWNGEMPFTKPVYPAHPTLFVIAKKAGYSTALVSGKDKFDIFKQDDALDYSWITTKSVDTDEAVADHAVQIITDNKPDVMLVHFPGVDSAGHSKGWNSPEQRAAIANADKQLKRVLDATEQAGLLGKTLVIISADHGGTARSHGPEDVRSRTIPWIAVGPGVRANYDLTLLGKAFDVQTFDTFSTACYVLGIAPEKAVDGKPIVQIFESAELVQPVK
jgi:predicted AlkP superfamily pyrophosphatase or phosphodiesterase